MCGWELCDGTLLGCRWVGNCAASGEWVCHAQGSNPQVVGKGDPWREKTTGM